MAATAATTTDAAGDAQLLRSLLRLSRDISLAGENAAPLQRPNFLSAARKARLLSHLFEDLLYNDHDLLPSSAGLCLKEILVVLQRFKALLGDCATRSRTHLLLQSDAVAAHFHDLTLDLSSLLGLLPLPDLVVSDDVRDLVDLVRRQSRRGTSISPASNAPLKSEILDTIRDIERGVVPERSSLESVLHRLGIPDARACRDEIDALEREIADRVAVDKWTPSMVAIVGLLRYAKCVVFGASTPRPEAAAPASAAPAAEIAVPADYRCPISLDLMRDPVVVASGQTYDRDSITRWIASGRATCPKSGQALAHTELIPNRPLRNLIARWCRDHKIPFDDGAAAASAAAEPNVATVNKAALEAARMTASFLVEKLAASPATEAANRVVHELRQLARTGSENRAFVAEAGAIPLLLPLLASEEPSLQVNAVTALLNLSILEANKKRIMHTDGAVEGVVRVLDGGATWRAKENAAATLLSLSAVHSYRRRLGRHPRAVGALVSLVAVGPSSTKKDALAAILSLAGDRENIPRLIEGGAVEAALDVVDSADVSEEAVAVLAAVAKRGGAAAVAGAVGSVAKLVKVLRRGSDWARECAAAALVVVCRKAGGDAVAELASMPGIECVIWELMASGTERARRKAASLGRICRRWVAAVETADRTARFPVGITA